MACMLRRVVPDLIMSVLCTYMCFLIPIYVYKLLPSIYFFCIYLRYVFVPNYIYTDLTLLVHAIKVRFDCDLYSVRASRTTKV